MKITKRQLTQIIREERARLAEQADPKGWNAWHNERMKRGFGAVTGTYLRTELAEILFQAVENYLGMRRGSDGMDAEDMRQLRAMLAAAADDIEAEYGVKARYRTGRLT